MFRTSYSYFWNLPQYTEEKPAVIRLAEPLAGKCISEVLLPCRKQILLTHSLVVLEVTIADDEQEDYIVFSQEVRQEWDCLHHTVCIQLCVTVSESN